MVKENHKPSSYRGKPWIFADSPDYDAIEDTSKVGKWLLWAKKDDVDAVWEKIEKATFDGVLGIEAKVSTALQDNPDPNKRTTHVICVYTKDYTDKTDVDRVREALRQMGFIQKMPYKTDTATLAGIYGAGSSIYYE